MKHRPQREGKISSKMRTGPSFVRRRIKCPKEEKPENKIEENLSLRRRKIETQNARKKSWPDLKDKSPDRFLTSMHSFLVFYFPN